MKTLLIVANPSKTSYTHALADAYKTWAEKRWDTVEMLDLYDFNQDILYYESTDELKKWNCNGWEKMKQAQKMLGENDEYVFFFPVWWWGMPAILKNFFDVNLSAGFAFNFIEWKAMPEKLLTNKTAKIFYHSDAPAFLYKMPLMTWVNIKKYISKAILNFCWIKVTGGMSIGGLRWKSDKQKKTILEQLANG